MLAYDGILPARKLAEIFGLPMRYSRPLKQFLMVGSSITAPRRLDTIKIKKTLIITAVVVVTSIFLVIAYFILPWLLMRLGLTLLPNPERPEITYSEFPFRLEYEINGERVVVEDTLICEYDGIGRNTGQGKYRKWKSYFASGREQILLLKVDNRKEIYYDPGPAEYYMDDMRGQWYLHIFPNACRLEKDEYGTSTGIINADELTEKYNIKLISWDYTSPIKNKFKE